MQSTAKKKKKKNFLPPKNHPKTHPIHTTLPLKYRVFYAFFSKILAIFSKT
jgi:hypothetical protein